MASYNFMAARNVPRPQVKFRDQVDNSNSPFVPRIHSKPNALQPLPDGGSHDLHEVLYNYLHQSCDNNALILIISV